MVDEELQLLAVMVLFIVIATSLETYFMHKQGAALEHVIGPQWGVAMLLAIGWRAAGAMALTRIGAGLIVVIAATCGVLWGQGRAFGDASWHVPAIVDVQRYPEVSELALVPPKGVTVYHKSFGDLGRRGDVVPPNYSVCDMAAAGLPATGFERELASRRWDIVYQIGAWDAYCSGFGKWEENYFWKLNVLIAAGYETPPSVSVPVSFVVKRTGTQPIAATRRLLHCFAPFRLAGVLFRIGHGGGFWCQRTRSTPRIALDVIPTQTSEIRTDGTVTAISGSLVITMPKGEGQAAVWTTKSAYKRRVVLFDAGSRARAASMVVTAGPVREPRR